VTLVTAVRSPQESHASVLARLLEG
jgi:uncharacterized protein YeaO (DUF488 family)